MFKGLFSQLLVIAISVGIILTYIQPTFVEVGDLQDNTATYKEERKKVAFVNQQLTALVNQINDIPTFDRQALETYLPDPDNMDVISIPRDLEYITSLTEAEFIQANLASAYDDAYTREDDRLIPYSFNYSLSGAYDDIKSVLLLLEQNNYPLEIHSLTVTPQDSGLILDVDMLLVTYAYEPPVIE